MDVSLFSAKEKKERKMIRRIIIITFNVVRFTIISFDITSSFRRPR